MQLNTDEFGALADMLSAQRITALNEQLEEAQKEADYWRKRCETAETMMAASEMENMFLKNCFILSLEKIKSFVSRLNSIDRWAFLRTFMHWTMPEELRARELPMIDKVMPMPDGAAQGGVVMNEPTFNGPMYDVHNNDEVKLEE